jgi:threonine dehydrogenase-like Zn-dependent dehydrogenase
MDVVGVDPLPFRREVAAACGIGTGASPDDAPAVLAGRGGARVVLECSGQAAAVLLATRLAARHGEVLTVGAPWAREPRVAADDILAPIFERYLTLRSGWEWQVPRYAPADKPSIAAATTAILAGIGAGRIDTAPLTTEIVRPEEAPDAYRRLASQPETHMTFLVDWRS